MTDDTGDSPDDPIKSKRTEMLEAIIAIELEIQAELKSLLARLKRLEKGL